MPASVIIDTGWPLNGTPPRRTISDSIEATDVLFEADCRGFHIGAGWPSWLPVFGRAPLACTWSYTDQNGHWKPQMLVSFDPRVSHISRMPRVRDGHRTESFVVTVLVHDSRKNRDHSRHKVTVHRQLEVRRRADRDRPVPGSAVVEAVSAEYPRGTAKYTESSSLTRTRSHSENISTTAGVKVPLAGLNVAFGVNVTETLSTGNVLSFDLEDVVKPGNVGVWHRKVQEYERHADVYEIEPSGKACKVGEVILMDYVFSQYLGQGLDRAAAEADARKKLGA